MSAPTAAGRDNRGLVKYRVRSLAEIIAILSTWTPAQIDQFVTRLRTAPKPPIGRRDHPTPIRWTAWSDPHLKRALNRACGQLLQLGNRDLARWRRAIRAGL